MSTLETSEAVKPTDAPGTSDTSRLPVAEPREVRRAIGRLIAHEKGTVALVCLLRVLAAAAGAALPVVLGGVVDGVEDGWSASRVDAVCLAVFGCVALQMALTRLGRRLGHRFGDRASARIREQALERVLRLPMRTVERAGTGDLTTRTTGDVDTVAGLLRSTGPEVVAAVLEVLVVVAAAFLVDPLLALLLAVVLPPLLIAARVYVRQARPAFLAERAALGDLTEALTATAQGRRTVAAHRLRERRVQTGRHLAAERYARQRAIVRMQSWFLPTLDLAYTLPVSAVLCGGGLAALGAGTGAGAVVAVAMLAYRLSGPLDRIMYSLTDFQEAAAALARVEGIGAVRQESRTGHAEGSRIELRGVTFGYGDGPDVLSDVDLDVRPGERLALVGPSGAGKSTVAWLIAGIERPRGGTALVGGAPSADIAPEDLRRTLVLVTQEHHVFAASLRDNLALARDDADDATLLEALRRVGGTWYEDLPEGLDTLLGEGRHALSLAQKQQLALARVLLADPGVVILDEATAGLDTRSAGDTEAALTEALAGRTLITITHQLRAAVAADRIAVVEKGRIAELGTHRELVARGGTYAQLWEAWSADRADDPTQEGRTTR
ncbi:ABC transporter ATP-binding protein [Streptomyces sp. NPDC032940]|uniref:ABC transporter ATP-binding protein n=1 Tax=Streptomyces sp. NPDC032940 TaxID=3155366 RepID=UPI00340B012E